MRKRKIRIESERMTGPTRNQSSIDIYIIEELVDLTAFKALMKDGVVVEGAMKGPAAPFHGFFALLAELDGLNLIHRTPIALSS